VGRFTGHSTSVQDVAVHPDGRLAVSAADDGIYVWDVRTCKAIRRLTADPADRVEFTPDGEEIACAIGSMVRIWSLESGDETRAFDRTSDRHTFGGGLWDIRTGRNIYRTDLLSPDGKTAYTGRLLDVDTMLAGARIRVRQEPGSVLRMYEKITGLEVDGLDVRPRTDTAWRRSLPEGTLPGWARRAPRRDAMTDAFLAHVQQATAQRVRETAGIWAAQFQGYRTDNGDIDIARWWDDRAPRLRTEAAAAREAGTVVWAEHLYARSVALDPTDVKAWRSLGECRMELAREYYFWQPQRREWFDEAFEAFQKANALEPSSFEHREQMAICLESVGLYREAAEAVTAAPKQQIPEEDRLRLKRHGEWCRLLERLHPRGAVHGASRGGLAQRGGRFSQCDARGAS
ncbi:MAG: WD40 repeat domain-containing protein, partial [Planctomycetota bacterium]